MTPDVSIVIPCYNEEQRLPRFFDPFIAAVAAAGLNYECLLVDDGSTDRTRAEIERRAGANPRIRTLTHWPNRGRGYSVRQGVLAARGTFVFETDADGSYGVTELQKFLRWLETHPDYDVVIATREHREARALVNQPPLRVLAGKIFHWLFGLFFGREFTDVMAGCKLYRQGAAQIIFRHQYDNEFLGAAETVYAARQLGFGIKELPVTWTDDPAGSKVSPFRAARRTFFGLLKMQLRSWQGKYRRTAINSEL